MAECLAQHEAEAEAIALLAAELFDGVIDEEIARVAAECLERWHAEAAEAIALSSQIAYAVADEEAARLPPSASRGEDGRAPSMESKCSR